jgi:type IV pilus assembly protein PilA
VLLAIHKRLEDREEGFTLIELLIVVIIIGILAAVAIPTFLNQRNRAFRAAVQSDLRNVAVEAETFFTNAQEYTGFAASDEFASFTGSQGVTQDDNLDVVSATEDTYCIEAFHTSNPTEIWNIRPGNQITEGACVPTPAAT